MAPSKAMLRFRADLKLATEKDYINITNVRKGEAEDEITFVFSHPGLPHPSQFEVIAQPQDVRSYPNDNSFLVYTNDDISPEVAHVLEESMFETMGMKVDNMLTDLSRRLRAALEINEPGDAGDVTMTDAGADEDTSDLDMEDAYSDSEEDISFEYNDDGYGSGSNIELGSILADRAIPGSSTSTTLSLPALKRFRRDLRSVLCAGFHTGIVHGLRDGEPNGIVSISIRVNKLCLPKETREAWGLVPSEYIVLLIKYDGFYSDFENAIDRPVELNQMSFRLRKCSKQKPSSQQASMAFKSGAVVAPTSEEETEPHELSNLWISKSMDDFMNSEFISVLKIRYLNNISWEKAKEKLRSQIIQSVDELEGTQNVGNEGEPTQLPHLLADDHFSSTGERSLPLIAMQFALRYLVRCTDYCTVCHRKVKGNFAALMPYVCSSPLCLHQYINLGFGPSIDHQIINHPDVIDLLISFSYAALSLTVKAQNTVGMRHFPTGLGLRVPRIRTSSPLSAVGIDRLHEPYLMDPIDISFNLRESVATITRDDRKDIVGVGQWVIVSTQVRRPTTITSEPVTMLHHARVEAISDKDMLLNVVSRHSMPDLYNNLYPFPDEAYQERNQPDVVSGHLVSCDYEFDDLDEVLEKAFSMVILLASMPPVADMRSYLMSSRQPLAKWGRMSPASVDLLRWIITSNRSHIVKVDDGLMDSKLTRHPERINGVDGWIQFRFTQGSPEKENLFYQALEQVRGPQKTLLAWHGSKLENWHSIIREGLDYNNVVNGRSYGNGIYFARDFNTSYGYAASSGVERMIWPQSRLRVQGVISLNELVNMPHDFQSTVPYFVVQHCHWTQCRYLFVKPTDKVWGVDNTKLIFADNNTTQSDGAGEPQHEKIEEFEQDRQWMATGPNGALLFIPKNAIPSARKTGKGLLEAEVKESELDSSDEDEYDSEFIWHEEKVAQTSLISDTDFRPGTLDFSSLPQLAPPSYATNIAQKALGQEIKKLEKIQSSTPLHLLGWYIDFERLNNLFQWIVELHSFDSKLPLAKDMKKAGLTSIVIEIRFLRGFPMSPPFVRVICPRFLPFMSGGGGHVTSGGALCMELLTNSGWSPANSLESVLLQVRMAICSEEPRPARLQSTGRQQGQYGVMEAVEAYKRAAATHGWEVPADLADASLSD
ncbi:uncharacterized protein F4807DRAFT_295600 [Annulohypoxylon truncatum]|uniref:uncharacterized protein n=1 Tax=Annulohypoxylon truncatum TaxID=327061 RepID=UPI0020078B04|nr:uncharacterized protein F4807DRAFT_295600 [Annulohypoxylon truncatum]KAI1205090.1 hypothetical protein F4807DRAFT_295600 [Annulohypoxylon truncatum]